MARPLGHSHWDAMRFGAAIRPAILRAVLVLGLASCVSTLGPGPHNPLRLPEEDDGLELYGWDADAREDQDEWGMPAFRERHIKVQRLSPSFGRHAGGLLVNITGKGFVIATDPKCQFGGEDAMMVNATVKSANWMQCWSPPNAETDGNIPWARTYDVYSRAVEVSLNGVDWTTSNRAFTYYAHEKLFVSLLEPQGGPTAGGTEITVHGSMFQQSDDLKCKFRRVPHVNCGTGYHVHNATCDMAPETVVDATFLSYWSLKCLSPAGFPESIGGTAHAAADGLPALPVDALNDIKTAPSVTFVEVALDAYHYTDHQREYHYYDDSKLAISAVDPIGGPTAGGTLIEILGSGFAELGGSLMHGSTVFGAGTRSGNPVSQELNGPNDRLYPSAYPHRRIDHGTFCKFSLTADSPMLVDFACTDAQCTEGTESYIGVVSDAVAPQEGEMALMDAASESHLRNFSTFTTSSTPSLGRWSSVVRATFVNPYLMRCEAPAFHGTLTNNRVTLDVRVVLNGDFHDLNAISNSNATFTLYDPYEARVNFMDRTGGPMDGNTSVYIRGKLMADYTSRALAESTTLSLHYTFPAREHLLRCRFGWVGETLATFVDEHTVKCASPPVNTSEVHPRLDFLGSGHADDVPVDLTFNGQDYLNGRDLRFIYSPRDEYKLNSSCLNQFGQVIDGTCENSYVGVAVVWLQPMGGPSEGGTQVVVTGQHFAVRSVHSIQCAFGGLPRVNATFVNDSAVLCVSPPAPEVNATFEDYYLDVTLNAETNFLTNSRVPFVYYNHSATLSVVSLYPQAGDKRGGNMITLTGTGFRVLGGINTKNCMSLSRTVNATEQLEGPRICRAEPEDESTNRGIQCIFGNMPPVKAYQVLPPAHMTPEEFYRQPTTHGEEHAEEAHAHGPEAMRTPHQAVTQITCEAPALPVEELTAAGLTPDDIFPVCVEVTLNGNKTQATKDCVQFTYYDF